MDLLGKIYSFFIDDALGQTFDQGGVYLQRAKFLSCKHSFSLLEFVGSSTTKISIRWELFHDDPYDFVFRGMGSKSRVLVSLFNCANLFQCIVGSDFQISKKPPRENQTNVR